MYYEPNRGGGGTIDSTDRGGRFRVERRRGDPAGPIRLRLEREDFESLISDARYPWGTEGLSFVLRRGLAVDIVVTDGETRAPIEDYAVRCFPDPKTRQGYGSADYAIRARGHHPEGRTRIAGITRGAQVLVIEPQDDRWPHSGLVPFEVTDAGAAEQRVELFAVATRALRVQRASGEPVAGTAVELLRPIGDAPVTVETRVVESVRFLQHTGYGAIAVMRGETDADGELVLRGPSHTALALRVLGPGHEPHIEASVVLAPDAPPLVVTVATGATITGRIGPAALLRAWQPRPETVAAESTAAGRQRLREQYRPGLSLRREREGRWESFPAQQVRDRMPVDEDGTFEMRGVPPGTWDAYVVFTADHGGGMSSTSSELLRTLPDLREGEVRELIAELDHLLPGRLTGSVTLNGVPFAGALLQLAGNKPDGRGGQRPVPTQTAKIAADGTFAMDAMPATYRVYASLERAPRRWVFVPADGTLVVEPGQELHRTFDLRTGTLRLRVRGSEGRPARALTVQVMNLDGSWRTDTPPTDDSGRTVLETVPLGRLELSVVPAHLTDPEARRAFLVANAQNPRAWEEAIVQLGQVEVVGGDEAPELEIELPASAGY